MISKEAKLLATFLRHTRAKKNIAKNMFYPKIPRKEISTSRRIQKLYDTKTIIVQNQPCFIINKRASSQKPKCLIFYFHGGGYTLPASQVHWHLMDQLMKGIDSTIIFVNYPLSPENTCKNTIEMVVEAYQKFTEDTPQEIVLMGDSAGGGLALALAQYLRDHTINPQPTKIVLLSPWLDISMDTAAAPGNEANDYILDLATLKRIGTRYAGEFSTKDPLCSPLYGDLTNLGKIALFTGTNDLLNAEAHALLQKAKAVTHELVFYEYPKMQHVWIGFPIPEAKEALAKLYHFVNGANNSN